jgi:hypothetical protein
VCLYRQNLEAFLKGRRLYKQGWRQNKRLLYRQYGRQTERHLHGHFYTRYYRQAVRCLRGCIQKFPD